MGSICSLKRATSVLASGQTDSSSSTSVWQKVQRNVPAGEKQSLQTCLQGAAWTEPAEKFRPQLLYIPADISQEVNLLVAIGAICALILVIYNQSGSGLVFMEARLGLHGGWAWLRRHNRNKSADRDSCIKQETSARETVCCAHHTCFLPLREGHASTICFSGRFQLQ